MIQLLAVLFVAAFGLLMYTIILSGHEEYSDATLAFDQALQRDFDEAVELIPKLSTMQSDQLIDEFEAKWKNYVSRDRMRTLIGKLIEAQMIYA